MLRSRTLEQHRLSDFLIPGQSRSFRSQSAPWICLKLSKFQSPPCRANRWRHRRFCLDIELARGFALMRETVSFAC